MDYENNYGSDYYESHLGSDDYFHNEDIMKFNHIMAENLVKALHPGSVLDVGCACGHLVSAFRDNGVEAYGIDSSSCALENVREDHRKYVCRAALPDIVLPDSFPKRYDLVTCIEVIEHIRDEHTRKSVMALAGLSDTILFSSTPDDFDEPTHINVHPVSFWCAEFAKAGFYPDMTVDLSFGAPQFVLFRKRTSCPEMEELFRSMDVLYRVKKTGMDLADERLAIATERLALYRDAAARAEELERELNGIRSRRSYRIYMKILRILDAIRGKRS